MIDSVELRSNLSKRSCAATSRRGVAQQPLEEELRSNLSKKLLSNLSKGYERFNEVKHFFYFLYIALALTLLSLILLEMYSTTFNLLLQSKARVS
jgi:hypothetical protein